MKIMLEGYVGSVCEVSTMDNDVLLHGRIQRVVETDNSEDGPALEIVAAKERLLPPGECGQKVKVHVFSKTQGLLALGGQVYLASPDLWRITSVTQYGNTERRAFFRVKVNGTGTVCGYLPARSRAADQPDPPAYLPVNYPVRVCSVSLAGILIQSEQTFEAEDALWIRGMQLSEDTVCFDLPCIVSRIDQKAGDTPRYGCRFEELDEKIADQLYPVIFRLQRREIIGRLKRI